jgi:hypothetical protein
VVKRWGEGRCGSCQKEGKGKSHGELLRGTIGGYLKTNGSLRQYKVCDALRRSGPHARYADKDSKDVFLASYGAPSFFELRPELLFGAGGGGWGCWGGEEDDRKQKNSSKK